MRKQIEYKENTEIPFRLRIYKLFKEQPKLIRLRKTSNQFETPKIKASFMKEYLNLTQTEIEFNNLLNKRTIDLVSQFKVYNMNDLMNCKEQNKQLDQKMNECERVIKSFNLINNYHLTKTRLKKHQDKLIQLDQLLKFSDCNLKETEDDELNEEFSKQILLLGDRWKEKETSQLFSRRKSIKFDESALDEKTDPQLLAGRYEVKQRAASKGRRFLI